MNIISDLEVLFKNYSTSPLQRRILHEAGINDPADPKFMQIIRASLDFVYHAETFFPDPNLPNEPLRLEPWQKADLRYCQFGEGFDPKGAAIRKPLAINSPRGFGKSVFSSVAADEFAIHFPYTKIALFSTSQDQANDLMEKVTYNIKHSIYSFMIDKKRNSKTEMGLSNGSVLKAFPQSEVTIRGFHPHIKIIDEKARIKREILESAIRPMGRKTCWLEIGISTPFGRNNNHYEDCMNPISFHTHLLKPTEVSWVDESKLKQNCSLVGDRIARQEYYAEFIEDSATIFKPLWIETMLTLGLKPKIKGDIATNYILGTDFGKHRDYTSICVLHPEPNTDIHIDLLERHLNLDYNNAIDRIRQISEDFNVKMIVPDGTGVGVAILEQLERKVRVPIYMSRIKKKDVSGRDVYRLGFIFSNTSKLNIVDELVKAMMNFKLKSPHHFNTTDPKNERYIFKVLENEMIDFSYTRTSSGNISFGHPEDTKSHDDTVIGVMLALWGLRYGNVIKPTFGGSPNIRSISRDKFHIKMAGNR